jgi:hypothetical protein
MAISNNLFDNPLADCGDENILIQFTNLALSIKMNEERKALFPYWQDDSRTDTRSYGGDELYYFVDNYIEHSIKLRNRFIVETGKNNVKMIKDGDVVCYGDRQYFLQVNYEFYDTNMNHYSTHQIADLMLNGWIGRNGAYIIPDFSTSYRGDQRDRTAPVLPVRHCGSVFAEANRKLILDILWGLNIKSIEKEYLLSEEYANFFKALPLDSQELLRQKHKDKHINIKKTTISNTHFQFIEKMIKEKELVRGSLLHQEIVQYLI